MTATVALLAHTTLTGAGFGIVDHDSLTAEADQLAEVAGRTCYGSYGKPNPKTRRNADYLANVIAQGHESVLSHASATFELRGVSRAFTHELVRHRWLSFSERSLRFVDASHLAPVYPPAADAYQRDEIDRTFRSGLAAYEAAVAHYVERGYPRKQAREAARAHLPLCTETVIVVSGNLRAWRDFLRQRCSPHADAEIRAVALEVLRQLQRIAPATFADLTATEEDAA